MHWLLRMRKIFLTVAALFFSVSAQAHVSAVPFPEIGSLRDVVQNAAFAIFQTYAGPPQIFYNIVTDAGAACNNNKVALNTTISITSGTKNLNVPAGPFVSGDAGKTILIAGAGGSGGTYTGTIATFSSATDVILSTNAATTVTATAEDIAFGTDDAPAFTTFNTWALANQASNQVVLTVPSGKVCWFATNTPMFRGVKDLIVEGAGATLSSLNGFSFALGDNNWSSTLGGGGVCQRGLAASDGCSARIQTVSAGASTVTLTSASAASGYISRFSVGKWIMVAGLDQQGLWNSAFGFPPNFRFFEWRQIVSCNASPTVCTGTTITLDRPLTNSYLDTWPQWNAGSNFEADNGGPASIFFMSDQWNTRQEYRGLTLSQSVQINNNGRFITYRNMTATGAGGNCGPIPSQNETWTAYNSNWSGCTMETDKLVGAMTIDGSTIARIDFQSASTDQFTLTNSTITSSIFGTPTRADISDTSIVTFRPGATGYGLTKTVTCTRCNVGTFSNTGGVTPANPASGSMTAGVYSWLNTDETGATPVGAIVLPPKGNIYYRGTIGIFGLFNVSALTQDATNAFAQTNEVGGLPTPSGGVTTFRSHPAPQWTCTTPNSASDPIFKSVCTDSGATALAPLWDYGKRAYAPSATGNIGKILNRGRLVSITIDVTTQSTHTSAITLNATGQFHLATMDQSSWTTFDWVPQINLKQAGTRVITPSGTTCNGVTGPGPGGSCSGDTCVQPASPGCFSSIPAAMWIPDNIDPYAAGTFSGGVDPQFTMTLRTDQGVVP